MSAIKRQQIRPKEFRLDMSTVAIVDYGVGNLGSIRNMLKRVGADFSLASSARDIERASKLILPGIGAFDHAVRTLKERELMEALNQRVLGDEVPILGVCLGMQILCTGSEEGQLPGFGWINASVRRFAFSPQMAPLKIPHMGWNSIDVCSPVPLLEGLDQDNRFYFVHSYHVSCVDREEAYATAQYGIEFDCVVGKKNILGAQFHPEKSHKFGMRLLRNFVENY